MTECLRNKREYRIAISVPKKTQSRTCENKLPCVFLAPERAFYEFGTLQFVPGTSTGCGTIFAQKGIPKMEQLSARLLLTAGILLLIAGGIFAILQGWLYTGLLWAGAFGCLMAALNFRDSKNDGG